MIPTAIEKALSEAVAPELTSFKRLCGADWKRCGADEPAFIAVVESLENVVGELWKATVRLRLEWPAFPEGPVQIGQFSATELAFSEWLANPENVAGLTIPNARVAGFKRTNVDPQSAQDDRWVCEFGLLIGLDGSAS